MYDFLPVGERTYLYTAPTNVGFFLTERNAGVLIDSGGDARFAEKLLGVIREHGFRLDGVVLTHAHADHMGGCRYLQAKTGCPVFAVGIEADLARHPITQPLTFFGGYPFGALRTEYLLAADFTVTDAADPSFPRELQIVPLPGHSPGTVGYRTPDGCLFLSDACYSERMLRHFGITFLYDVGAFLDTLTRISSMEAKIFIPSHAEPTADVRPLLECNRDAVRAVLDAILDGIREPICFDLLLGGLITRYHRVQTPEQYAIVGSTVRSCLSYLIDRGDAEYLTRDGVFLFHATENHGKKDKIC